MILAASLTLFLVIGIIPVAQAVAPYTTIGSADVDGNIGEWDLTEDYFADMTRGGNDPSIQHPVESKFYLRYDVDNVGNGVLYILVLTQPGVIGLLIEDDAWVAIGGLDNKVVYGNSGNDADQPNFAWVGQGYDGDSNHVQGYEASFSLAQGEYTIHVHLQVQDDGEAQTSRTLKAGLDLFVVPEYALPLIGIISCFAAFGVYKKLKR